MRAVGIEALDVYGGAACLDMRALCAHRGLDILCFENLLIREKSVTLPWAAPK